MGEGRRIGTLSHTACTHACLHCNHINLVSLGNNPKNNLNLIMPLEGYKSKAALGGISCRISTENALSSALGKVASLSGVGAARLEGWGPYFGVSGFILEAAHHCAERVGVAVWDRNSERRIAGKMLVDLGSCGEMSSAPVAQCRAPGM